MEQISLYITRFVYTIHQGWLKSAILGGGSSYKDLGLSLGGV